MPSQRSVNRILLNIVLDGALAAAAVPLARWIAAPAADPFHPLRLLADGAASLLIAGLPFRLPLQYWRFAGIRDLLAVAGSSALAAGLLALLMAAAGTPAPTPTFPIVHALTLALLLGTPRVLYRLARAGGAPPMRPPALIRWCWSAPTRRPTFFSERPRRTGAPGSACSG